MHQKKNILQQIVWFGSGVIGDSGALYNELAKSSISEKSFLADLEAVG